MVWRGVVVLLSVLWPAAAAGGDFRVIGYLPEYRFGVNIAKVAEYVTDIIAFSIEPLPTGMLNKVRLTSAMLTKLKDLKATSNVRTHVSIGGGGRSSGYASATSSALHRSNFASDVARFLDKWELDGVDFDWEAPITHEQMQNYVELLREVRRVLGKSKTISLALHPSQSLGSTSWYPFVDFVHLMAYDNAGDPTGHSTISLAHQSVRFLHERGVPYSRIVLGIPAYGRGRTGNVDRVLTYSELVESFAPPPSIDAVAGLTFNGITTVSTKTRWAQSQGLAGVVVWEVGQDVLENPEQSLLGAIARSVVRKKSEGEIDEEWYTWEKWRQVGAIALSCVAAIWVIRTRMNRHKKFATGLENHGENSNSQAPPIKREKAKKSKRN